MANMMTPLGCNKCGYRKRTTGELITLRARIAELEAENARLKVGRVREAAVVKAAIVWANDCPLGQRAVDKLINAVRALSGEREG